MVHDGMVFTFRITLILSGLGLCLLNSCTIPWSEKKKARLESVALVPTELAGKAYRDPKVQDPWIKLEDYEGGGGPLDGVVLGMWGWKAIQQAALDSGNKEYYAELARKLPSDLGKALDQRLTATLRNDPFFGPRLAKESANKFSAEILRYGFEQAGRDGEGKHVVRARVEVKVRLRIQYPDRFLGMDTVAASHLLLETMDGVSKHLHPVPAIAADPQLGKEALGEALDDVVSQLTRKLDRRLGR